MRCNYFSEINQLFCLLAKSLTSVYFYVFTSVPMLSSKLNLFLEFLRTSSFSFMNLCFCSVCIYFLQVTKWHQFVRLKMKRVDRCELWMFNSLQGLHNMYNCTYIIHTCLDFQSWFEKGILSYRFFFRNNWSGSVKYLRNVRLDWLTQQNWKIMQGPDPNKIQQPCKYFALNRKYLRNFHN